MLSDEQAIKAVQAALHQLYDTQALRTNPLIESLGLTNAPNAVSELRQVITETVRGLQPSGDVPPEARAWRIHEILEYRFVQQVGQAEVARQLGLSVRHLRREERRAAEVLTQKLRPRLMGLTSPDTAPVSDANLPTGSGAFEELAWLDGQVTAREVDLGALLGEVIGVTRPLAEARSIAVQLSLPDLSLSVTIQPVALREMILELLTAAICHAAARPVTIAVRPDDDAAMIEIGASLSELTPDERRTCEDTFAMARQIAARCGAAIETSLDAEHFAATIALPLPQGVSVLVIDDNDDTLRLLRRYVAGTPFAILATSTLAEALALAAETRPQIIVLDVMMPHVDGWELLARLRQHPLTMHAPVVVCSILTQEKLAFSLGACEYLRKPVSARAFVQTLDRALHRAASESP